MTGGSADVARRRGRPSPAGRAPEGSLPQERHYRFVQWEFPWALGPDDGRYLLRRHAGEEPHHVLVVATLPLPKAGLLARRRAREAPPEPPPSEVAIGRVTLVDTDRVDDDAARAWLAGAAGEQAPDVLADALAWLNYAIARHRAATADPYIRELDHSQALVTRVGYGVGEDVADGRWSDARTVAPARPGGSRRERRMAALRPQERLAALLSGRDAVLACEELSLRARLDLDQSRTREAAMQAHIALEAAVAELQAFTAQRAMAARVDELDSHRDALAAAANEALRGGLSEESLDAVRDGLERLEAALRARSATAQY